jgi:hypothetical protein
MTDLFGKEPAKKKRKSPFDSAAGQRLLLYVNKWEENYLGEKYAIIWSFNMKMARELEDVPMDTVAERLDIYFRQSFYRNCKHSLAAFVKNFNQFIPNVVVRQQPAQSRALAPKSMLTCADCQTSHEYGKECENPECPTNAWKLLPDTTSDEKRSLAAFLSSGERGVMRALDGSKVLSEAAEKEIKDIKQQQQRR